jgi:hypothetical protein
MPISTGVTAGNAVKFRAAHQYSHRTNKRLSRQRRLRVIAQTRVNFVYEETCADMKWFSENSTCGFTAAAPGVNANNYVVQRP